MENLGEYHDLYLKSDTLLLPDIFGNSTKMCLGICQLDPVKFLSAPRLAWKTAFEENQSKIRIIN